MLPGTPWSDKRVIIFVAALQQKYLVCSVAMATINLGHNIVAHKFFPSCTNLCSIGHVLQCSIAPQCNNMLHKRVGVGGGGVFNLSNNIIARHQWTSLAASIPSPCSAAYHPVKFCGYMLRCGIGLHCDNLSFAGHQEPEQ